MTQFEANKGQIHNMKSCIYDISVEQRKVDAKFCVCEFTAIMHPVAVLVTPMFHILSERNSLSLNLDLLNYFQLRTNRHQIVQPQIFTFECSVCTAKIKIDMARN